MSSPSPAPRRSLRTSARCAGRVRQFQIRDGFWCSPTWRSSPAPGDGAEPSSLLSRSRSPNVRPCTPGTRQPRSSHPQPQIYFGRHRRRNISLWRHRRRLVEHVRVDADVRHRDGRVHPQRAEADTGHQGIWTPISRRLGERNRRGEPHEGERSEHPAFQQSAQAIPRIGPSRPGNR